MSEGWDFPGVWRELLLERIYAFLERTDPNRAGNSIFM